MARLIFYILLFICCLFSSCKSKDGPDRTSVNLISYFEDADLIADTISIDFGHPSSRIHLEKGWGNAPKEKDGATVSVLKGRGTLWFYSLYPTDRRLRIRCKSADETENPFLVLFLNGQRLEERDITSDFEQQEFTIPASILVAGKNQMALQIRNSAGSGVLLDYLSFDPERGNGKSTAKGIMKNPEGIAPPVPSQAEIYLKLPEQAELSLEYGLLPSSSGDAAARFVIRIENAENKKAVLLSRILKKGWLSGKEKSQTLSLAPFGKQIVKLAMDAFPVEGRSVPEQVYWKNLKLAFPTPHKTEEVKASIPNTTKRPNVFFYLIDALRADHLQPYGYEKEISPNIAQFAGESVLFERAYAQSSWTRPAVTSILTGLYPSTHGTMDRADMIAESIPTLQSLLRAAGYRMNGFNAQPNVGKVFGFQRSFDFYKLIADSHSGQVYSQIEDFLSHDEFVAPAFTYVHVIDTHRPYSPLPQFAPKMQDCRAEKEISRQLKMDCALLLYNSLIFQSDFYFGVFLDLLKKKNLYEDSLIILTADHGESFMEHGMFGHGKSVFETEIRVPLLIRFPGGRFAKTRVADVVQHIDLLPTILELTSIPLPDHLEGRSLLPFLKGPQEIRPVYSELSLDNQDDRALLLGDYKLISIGSNSGPRYRLYNVATDPNERKDVRADAPVQFGYMRTLLNRWSRAQQKKTHRTKKAVIDPETEEQLKGLGYLQ